MKQKKISLFYAFWLLVCTLAISNTETMQAQVILQEGFTPDELVETIVNQGVNISNVELNCPDGAYGTFNAEGTGLGAGGDVPFGMSDGVILTTGEVLGTNGPSGPNTIGSTGTDNGGDDYDILTNIAGFPTFNACVLEFDIIPQGDVLSFNYAFGSDEYDEFVCSDFNDVFGFFVSGPNPDGGNYSDQNIALIPDSDLPVAINTVNNGSPGSSGSVGNCISLDYADLFVSNPEGSPDFEYDGFTVPLTATVNVVPCQSYHLILAIADAGDPSYDSGVFLEAGSFSSIPEFSISTNVAGTPTAVEGCTKASFIISTENDIEGELVVPYTIEGDAVNGIDYESLSGSVTLTAAQLAVEVEISALFDDEIEGTETITISVSNIEGCEESQQSLDILILDAPVIDLGEDRLVCEPVTLSAENDVLQDYLWSNGSNASSITVSEAGVYWVSIGNGCITDTVMLESAPALSIELGDDQTVCGGQMVMLDATTEDATEYLWSNGSTEASISVTEGGNYSVQISNACSQATDEVSVNIFPDVVVDLGGDKNFCLGESNILDAAVDGFATYLWSDGSTNPMLDVQTTGIYSVTVTNDCGTASDEICVLVQSCEANCEVISVTHLVDCNDTDTSYEVYMSVSGGLAPYTVTGDYEGVLDADNVVVQFGPVVNGGFYQFDVVDAAGCLRSVLGKPDCVTTPVELLSYKGRTLETGNLLEWQVASELNNDFYSLEVAYNQGEYKKIAEIEATGTSNTTLAYDYLDKNIQTGTAHYRLTQTDFDGTSKHLGVVTLNRLTTTLSFNDIQPIPSSQFVNVSFEIPTLQTALVMIHDISGRLLLKKEINATQGTNAMQLDISDFPTGIYTLSIGTEQGRIVEKIVKQ
ncbi:MAG: choice-of-anchor L domain-containing protein [Chitinophagales bacterium]